MLMQNFEVTNKEHYGMLWYFLEWSIALRAQPKTPCYAGYSLCSKLHDPDFD